MLFSEIGQNLMAVGLLIAAIDMLIFGFATLLLTLIGLSLVTTGALIEFNILSDSLTSILLSSAILTALYGAILWRPLKNLQRNKHVQNEVKSDLVGLSFVLEQDISATQPGTHHFSGIDWKVMAKQAIEKGTEVEVIELQVGVMTVQPK